MEKVVVVALLLLTGCSADPEKVKYFLEADGCSETIVGGWTLTGCSDKDAFKNSFSCIKNGKSVNGVVCSGWFKGYTIRYQ